MDVTTTSAAPQAPIQTAEPAGVPCLSERAGSSPAGRWVPPAAGGRAPSEATHLLFGILEDVVHTREPALVAALRGEPVGAVDSRLAGRELQARRIWFQLLAIAEQFETFRARRRTESAEGPEHVGASFARLLREWRERGVDAAAVRRAVEGLWVSPVITAHPTEAKRVTVLEKHCAIYELLLALDSPRLTSRERDALAATLRSEVELLWLTGELHLHKPTVLQEVSWALHFFRSTLFDVVPVIHERLQRALADQFPGERFEVGPFLEFGVWVGGDRDGNPNVTPAVTREALREYRLASLRRYRTRLVELARELSVSQELVAVPLWFQRALTAALARSGDGASIAERNPGEVFRQFAACMLRRMESTLEHEERGWSSTNASRYAAPEELAHDVRALERALAEVGCGLSGARFVTPLRRGSRPSASRARGSTYASIRRSSTRRWTPSPPHSARLRRPHRTASQRRARTQPTRPAGPVRAPSGSRRRSPRR
jgi:phosphoenolpyruvate carboxylase